MWQVVLNEVNYAPSHEPRVRNGEKDSVQALLQEIPAKVEPRTASKENPPEAIQARSAEQPEGRRQRRL